NPRATAVHRLAAILPQQLHRLARLIQVVERRLGHRDVLAVVLLARRANPHAAELVGVAADPATGAGVVGVFGFGRRRRFARVTRRARRVAAGVAGAEAAHA